MMLQDAILLCTNCGSRKATASRLEPLSRSACFTAVARWTADDRPAAAGPRWQDHPKR